jgi:hypothetical protein
MFSLGRKHAGLGTGTSVTFAAWLHHQNELPQVESTVAVISGGNIEKEMLAQILAE